MRVALLLVLLACKSEPPPPSAPGSGSATAPVRAFGVVAELPGTPALVAGTRTFALHGDDRWWDVKAGVLVENRPIAAAIASEQAVSNVLLGATPVIVAGEEHHEKHARFTPAREEVPLFGLASKIATTKRGLEGWLDSDELREEVALVDGGTVTMPKRVDRIGPIPENLSPVRAKLCEHPRVIDVAASDTSVFALVGECSPQAPLRVLEYKAQDADPIDRQLSVLDIADAKLVVTRDGKLTIAGIRAGKLVVAPIVDGKPVPAEHGAASRMLAALASGDSVWSLVVDPSGKHTVLRDDKPVEVELPPAAIGYDETLGAVILSTDGSTTRLYAERALIR